MHLRKGLHLIGDEGGGGGGGGGPATMETLLAEVKGLGDRFEERMKAIEAKVDAVEAGHKEEQERTCGQFKAMGEDWDKFADESRKRMRLVKANVFRGGRYNGLFGSPEQARDFGLFATCALFTALNNKTLADRSLNLLKAKSAQIEVYEKALFERNDESAGILVPTEDVNDLIRHVEAFGSGRRLFRTVPLASDKKRWPRRKTGLKAWHVDEGEPIPESELKLDSVSLEPQKLAVLTSFSTELEEDAFISIAELIAEEAAQAYAETEDDDLFNGDGTSAFGRNVGVFNSTGVSIYQLPSTKTAFDDITYKDLVNVQSASPGFVTNRRWMMSPTVLGIIRNLTDSNGNPIISDTPLMVGEPRTLLGDPVEIVRKAPVAGDSAANKAFMAFGDGKLSHFFGIRREIRLGRSDDVGFKEDMVFIKVTERVGYAERKPDALTIVKTAAS